MGENTGYMFIIIKRAGPPVCVPGSLYAKPVIIRRLYSVARQRISTAGRVQDCSPPGWVRNMQHMTATAWSLRCLCRDGNWC
jgi:hypothetical protein